MARFIRVSRKLDDTEALVNVDHIAYVSQTHIVEDDVEVAVFHMADGSVIESDDFWDWHTDRLLPRTRPEDKPEWPSCSARLFLNDDGGECRRHAPAPVLDKRVWQANERIDDEFLDTALFPDMCGKRGWCGEWRAWDGEDFLTRTRIIAEWLKAHPGESIEC